jgi:cell division protein FtsW (lipid II flippase)
MLSKDLGSAVIFFVTYLILLFLATGKWSYMFIGLLLGVIGAVICYFLFAHVRVRVQVFLDPWSSIDGSGYQITQSLFAISFGGLFGAGLMQGMPSSIPFVESDFIFAAIIEEMGIIFGICLVLICLNIFTDFLLLASNYSNKFYRLYTFGTAIAFIFQAFLTIGGEVKFIPLTGVTLPLVSYGGSSVLATFIMFGIVGAIFMLQEERLARFSMRYEEERRGRDRSYMYEGNTSRQEQKEWFHDKGDEDQDFYKDFKGVPIYDPSKDYENMNHFDV